MSVCHYFPSIAAISSVTERASIGNPSSRATLRSFRHQFGLQIQLQQAEHLRIAVLLHHVNALMRAHKVWNLVSERKRSNPQVIGRQFVFFAQLVARFDQCPMRAAESDDSNFGIRHGLRSPARAQPRAHFRTCVAAAPCCFHSLPDARCNCACALCPLPRVKYAAAGCCVPGKVR